MKRLLAALAALASVAALSACGDTHAVAQDAGIDAGPPDASCFMNPQTHDEIINACTTAQKIYKDSHPALLNPDGTLPSLPN